jgi:NTE family protein
MLNINHFITSQTNPLVLPMLNLYATRPGLAAALARAGGNMYLHGSAQLLDILRRQLPLRTLNNQLDLVHAIHNQTYASRDMHIQMPFRPLLYPKILSNPSPEEFHDYTLMGERATWPRIAMIRDRTHLSRMFGNAIGMLMQRVGAARVSSRRRAPA